MVATGNAAPLIGLDAVVIDTETTGLDAGKARLLEVAVVHIVGGRPDPSGTWRSLVQPGESDSRRGDSHPRHRRRKARRRAGLCRGMAGACSPHRRPCRYRPHGGLRHGHAEARVPAGRHLLAAPAPARHAAAGPDRQAQPCRILARPGRQLARRRDCRPAFGAGRRADHRSRVPRPRADAARARHPHAGRSHHSLSHADRRPGSTAPRRLGRGRRVLAPRYRARARPHRQLSLSASHPAT